MASLASETDRLLNASLAKSTWNSYNNAIAKFDQFRLTYNLERDWPAQLSSVVAYIAFMSIEGWAHSSICLHVAALAFIHKINAWADPTESFIIKKLREGSRRVNMTADLRRPITFDLLKRLIQVLPVICKSAYESTLFKAVFMLAYFGFLRAGEYACASKRGDVEHILSLHDVSFSQSSGVECVRVLIRFSKTDQLGTSSLVHIEGNSDTTMCPVQALKQYLQIRPVSTTQPLFIHFDSEVLTRHQVNSTLKLAVGTVGLPPNDFSPHSFRIGAATSAAMQGIQDEDIKSMGRWKSGAFRSYIRPHRLLSFI